MSNRNSTQERIDLRRGESPTATIVTLGPITLVYSYSTVVAFAVAGEGWTASENVWSKTTGKHLNQEVPRGVERIPHAEFSDKLDAILTRVSVSR
jgi:hypothetical protein